jgi:hypothetical protein
MTTILWYINKASYMIYLYRFAILNATTTGHLTEITRIPAAFLVAEDRCGY